MESCFNQTITQSKVVEGAHRLMLSLVLAVSTTPKTALASFPILASLGSVTDKLQTICGWDASVLVRIKETHRMRNGKVRDSGLFHHFFAKFDERGPKEGASTPDRPSLYLGKYYKLMLSDIAEASLQKKYWETEVNQQQLDLAKKFFNKKDSDVAIITSELLDLHASTLALTASSNFNSEGMSEPDTHFSGLESLSDLNSFLSQSTTAQNEYLEANIAEERVRWSTQVHNSQLTSIKIMEKFFQKLRFFKTFTYGKFLSSILK